MDNKGMKYITILETFVLPSFLSKKLVLKIGIPEYLDYKLSTSSYLFSGSGSYLDLAFKADDNAARLYLQGLTYEDNFDSIRKIINSKSFPKYASLFSKDLIRKLILNTRYYSSEVEILLKNYDGIIREIIQEDIANNQLEKYLLNTPNSIKTIFFEYLSIDQIMFLYEKTKYFNSDVEMLFQVREKDIKDYITSSIQNDPETAFKFVGYNLPEHIYEYICSMMVIDDSFFKKVFIDTVNSRLQNFILNYKYEEVFIFVDGMLNSGNFKELLKYGVPEDILNYVINSLDDDEIISLLEESYVSSSVKNIFYKSRYDDIYRIIIDISKTDILKAISLVNHIDDDEFVKKLIKSIDISRDAVKGILDNNLSKYLILLYNIKRDYVVDYLLEKRRSDSKFFDKSFEYGYNDKILKDITVDLSDEELITIFSNYHFGHSNKDVIFPLYKDRWMSIFKNIFVNDPEQARRILLDCGGTKFRNLVIDTFPVVDLLKSDIYYGSERDTLFKERYYDFTEGIKKLFYQDKYTLFKLFFNFRAEVNDLNNYVLSLYQDEDILDVLLSNADGNKLFMLTSTSEVIYPRVKEAVLSQSRKLAYEDWDKYVLLLKGLRSTTVDLFLESIRSLDIDDNLLDKLYSERGLSDAQKEILMKSFGNDIKRIVKDNISNDRNEAFKYLQKGTDEEILGCLLNVITKDELKELLDSDDFVKRRSIGEKFASKLYLGLYSSEERVKKVNYYLGIYKGNKYEFIKNFEIIYNFLNEIHIDIDDFFQYALNGSYNFIPDVVHIYNTHLKDFIDFKDYFISFVEMDDKPYTVNLLKIIKNFARYDDLCISITRNKELNNDNIKELLLLFSREETLSVKPSSIEECNNIRLLLKDNFKEAFSKCETIDDYKEILSNILFNTSYKELLNKLKNYGNTADLITLKYYNKGNSRLYSLIDEIIVCTSIIEDIVAADDIDVLREVALNSINNLDSILEDLNYYNYDEKMREIYALEMDFNLTKIDNGMSEDFVKDEAKSLEYGVTVYDFRDKEYALLAHVKSEKETYDDLINGVATGERNFISFSSISYRNECYYYGARNMIFGYDYMPLKNFVFSSIDNMGTNRNITNNSSEVKDITRTQRGLLEISDTDGNSEVLALRSGLKPKYIIVPDGRDATSEEIEIAKKYNLIICFTQERNHTIDSPKSIPNSKTVDSTIKTFSKEDLLRLQSDLITEKESRKRRVAIITDIHGLLEPTVAVLEDIRKRGITEIYSLGDNIGTGPNPEEVVDLLECYGVKSIKGNHELYLENIEDYYTHLVDTDSLEEETSNSDWTRNHLRSDQLSITRNYNDFVELYMGGKRILLCHFLKDYNTGENLFNPDDYDMIFEGHKHFSNVSGNIHTLKAVGIGNMESSDIGSASYTILTEEDGDVSITPVNIKYNHKNTIASINKSTANTRVKMKRWVGSK